MRLALPYLPRSCPKHTHTHNHTVDVCVFVYVCECVIGFYVLGPAYVAADPSAQATTKQQQHTWITRRHHRHWGSSSSSTTRRRPRGKSPPKQPFLCMHSAQSLLGITGCLYMSFVLDFHMQTIFLDKVLNI